MKKIFFFIGLFCLVSRSLFACDSSGCALARINSEGKFNQAAKSFFTDFTFEQQVWHQRDVALAHALHHRGHDSHDKLREEFYHFGLGANFGSFSFLAELPYVVRHALEVDNHAILGQRQRSEGFGDLSLTGIFKLFEKENDFIGPLAGIKLPTGQTTERNRAGNKFEPELQPGSGSVDPILGSAFQYRAGRIQFSGNTLYSIRTRGAQEYEFGNLFSAYLYVDYLLNPESKFFNSKVGLDTTLQNAQKDRDRQGPVADSGGTTWLLGPKFSIQANKHISVFGNILFPIYQNLGGIHQLVQFVWNAGVKISF